MNLTNASPIYCPMCWDNPEWGLKPRAFIHAINWWLRRHRQCIYHLEV